MSEVFHLGLTKAMLEGATLAITPGAPERVENCQAFRPSKIFSIDP